MAPKLVYSKIKLTIGMLVSNHVQYIRNCMESIQPLLKTIPSELVVIDTKGEETDGSIAIVREYTDKIFPFTWCNDFSAARNAILEHASGEWFLYFDDDEWFDNVQEFIDFFQSGECDNYYTGFYYTRDYAADGTYSMGIAGRMIRRTENTRFVGKVHEGFNEVFSPNKCFSCFTHHYGYAFATEESKQLHQQRNLMILREELKAQGASPRLCAQIVQELLYRDETREEGFSFCMESIDLLKQQGKLMDACSQWVLIASVRYYKSIKDYKKLLLQAEFIRNNFTLTQMAQLALSGVVTELAAEQCDIPTIIQNVECYCEANQWLRGNKEEALLQTQLDFPRYDTEEYYTNMLQAGAKAANAMGKFDLAYHFWSGFCWSRENFDGSGYKEDLLITLRGMKDRKPLVEYYRHFYKEECFLPENREYLPKECREALEQVKEM